MIAIPILLCAPPAPGADPYVFDANGAVRFAAQHNPQLRAARLQIEAAEARLKWSGRLADPEFETSASTDQFGLNEGEGSFEVAFAQRFPLTHRLRREKELSETDLALAKAELAVQQWRLAGEVRNAVAQMIALKQRAELRDRMLEIHESLLETLRSAAQRGEASQLDLSEEQLEVESHVQELKRIDAEQARAEGELRTLLGLEPASPMLVSDGIPLQPVPYVVMDEGALAAHPQIQLLALKEDRARAALALAASLRWQDVAVKLFLEKENVEDEPEGLERNTFVGVGFSLPLPLRTPKARLTEAPSKELEAAQATTAAEAARIRNEVAAAQKELEFRHDMAQQATGELLQLARRRVEQVTEAWKTGQLDLVRLQRAQEQVLRLEEAAIEARHAYQQARVRLEQAAGGTLNPSPK